MAVDQARQNLALMRARAAASVAFGDMQVILMRELAVWLKAGDTPADRSLSVEAMTDQLETAVREMRCVLDAAQQAGTADTSSSRGSNGITPATPAPAPAPAPKIF